MNQGTADEIIDGAVCPFSHAVRFRGMWGTRIVSETSQKKVGSEFIGKILPAIVGAES